MVGRLAPAGDGNDERGRDIDGGGPIKGRPAAPTSSRPGPSPREDGRRRRALFVVAGSLLAALVLAPAAARPAPDASRAAAAPLQSTALAVTATGAPLHVRGSDGREHIEYDLVISNAFTVDATLRSLEVRDGRGRLLLRREGDALASVTHPPPRPTPPTRTVPASGLVSTSVDVAVRPRALPTRLTNRISYELPPDAPGLALIGSRRVDGPELRLARREPIVIAPPLRGPGWVALAACCESPSAHRDLLFPANGRFVTPEMFAIDWVALRDGRLYEGDGSQTTQWHAEGAPLLAVGDGRVVRAVDGRPEIAPAPFGTAILRTADEFAGNYVVVRIRRGVYAIYAHVRPGTVRVRIGQRVRTGQRLGELGNSGNTTAPHLHFSINDGPDLVTSNSLPWEFDRFRLAGHGALQDGGPGQAGVAPEVPITGTPRRLRRAYPLSNAVVDFRLDTTPPRIGQLRARSLPGGARLALRLSEAATVRVRVTSGGRLRRRLSKHLRRGARSLTVRGLSPGRYRARLTATDAAGNRSRAARTSFGVGRR